MSLSSSFTVDQPKAFALGAFLIGTSAFLGWIAVDHVSSGTSLTHIVWLNALLLASCVVASVYVPAFVVWRLYQAGRTEISEFGVSQPQFRGPVSIAWNEFTRVEVSLQQGVDLFYVGGKVLIAAGLYRDPARVVAFIRGKVGHLCHARPEV